MNRMKKCLSLFSCMFLLCNYSDAQPVKYTSTVNAAGGTANIGGNNYEWSVGEMALVNTGTGSNITVTQGVLQPAQSTGNVDDYAGVMKNVSVYPVPTRGVVYIQHEFVSAGSLNYKLMDITGKLILERDVEIQPGTGKQEINLENLPNASYMLHLVYNSVDNTRTVTSFKLDKLN
jgi:hypothetical protein